MVSTLVSGLPSKGVIWAISLCWMQQSVIIVSLSLRAHVSHKQAAAAAGRRLLQVEEGGGDQEDQHQPRAGDQLIEGHAPA